MRGRALLAGLVGVFTLGGTEPEAFMGMRVNLAGPASPGMQRDVRGHLGCGVGVVGGWEFTERQALRLSLDYLGTHVLGWDSDPGPTRQGFRSYREIWRVFRLGCEHVVQQGALEEQGVYCFYGAGVQEAWVNRTEGSLLETFLVGVTAAYGGGGGSQDLRLSAKATASDTWGPFATFGVGARLGRRGTVELRYVWCRYGRDRIEGLKTWGKGPVDRVPGRQWIVSWGMGF